VSAPFERTRDECTQDLIDMLRDEIRILRSAMDPQMGERHDEFVFLRSFFEAYAHAQECPSCGRRVLAQRRAWDWAWLALALGMSAFAGYCCAL
jgi:hypothetical protein